MSSRKQTRPDPKLQSALFDLASTHRLEAATNKAITRGYAEAVLDQHLDASMVALARTLARTIDEAASPGGDRWLLARLTGELRETLIRLRLDPISRGGERDDFADLVEAMRSPSVGNTANTEPA